MDDNEIRYIPEDTINAVIGKLNPDFIKQLPVPPHELSKYVTRRVAPVISDNISFSLGQKMLENRMSDEEYFLAFLQALHTTFYSKSPSSTPCASILISQTGAGKTNLRKLILETNPNSIIINPDLYKKFNPKLERLLEDDPTHIGALTGIDSYDHARNMTDFAIRNKYDLLFECAPSSDRLIGVDIPKLQKNNYNIQYNVLAVGDLVSSIAIHYRYEQDLKNKADAKLTDLTRHNESYIGVKNILKSLPISNTRIFRRGSKETSFLPQLLENNNNLLVNLELEREKSNRRYAFSKDENSFKSDFNKIQDSMKKRNAPEEQFKQISEIYKNYNSYILNEISK